MRNIIDDEWAHVDITYVPADIANATDWRIRFGPSQFLLAEGPGNTDHIGRQLFLLLSLGRPIEKLNPREWVCRAID